MDFPVVTKMEECVVEYSQKTQAMLAREQSLLSSAKKK
jgi:hypothetical protein